MLSGTLLRTTHFISLKAVVSVVRNCWLVACWSEVLQWLSYDAVAKMLHPANTIENINAAVMYTAPVICHHVLISLE